MSSKLRDSIAYEPSETGSSDEDDGIGQDSESSEAESSEGSDSDGRSSVAPTPKAVTDTTKNAKVGSTIEYADSILKVKNSEKSEKSLLSPL